PVVLSGRRQRRPRHASDTERRDVPQDRKRLGANRCASAGEGPVSARHRVLGSGPHADHADALVAEHAKAGDRVAGPASVCRADESSPELEEALHARRTERVELTIGADYERKADLLRQRAAARMITATTRGVAAAARARPRMNFG